MNSQSSKTSGKCYNGRHATGISFEVGMLVLKKNSLKSLSKLTPKYLGPYSIVNKCANGNFKLKNKYSHFLKTSIHPSRLVWFYKDKLYKVNKKGEVDVESASGNGSDNEMSYCSDMESECSNINTCK